MGDSRNPVVPVYRDVTESSFDASSWQTLETKARFIPQVTTRRSDLRGVKDIHGAALTHAGVKAIASGNPLVIEKATIDAELARLTRRPSQTGKPKTGCVRRSGGSPRTFLSTSGSAVPSSRILPAARPRAATPSASRVTGRLSATAASPAN